MISFTEVALYFLSGMAIGLAIRLELMHDQIMKRLDELRKNT